MSASSKRLAAITLGSWFILLLISGMIPQRISYDPALGFTALKQYLKGESPSINHFTSPDPKDLSRDTTYWIYWWPPSSQFLAYPLMKIGLTLKQAIRILVLFCIGLGALGWSIWISRFEFPSLWKIVLAASFPWIPYGNRGFSSYSAETLVFGLAPWILLATALLAERWESDKESRGALITTGVLFAFSYWVKYTLVFIPIGCIAYLTIQTLRSGKSRQFLELMVVSGLLICSVFSLNVMNWLLSKSLNPISCTLHPLFRWEDLFFAVSLFPIALANADLFWKFTFMHPIYGLYLKFPGVASMVDNTPMWLAWMGLPGALWILWIISHRRRGHRETDLSAVCLFTTFFILLALFIVSFSKLYQSRYVAATALAILPLCLQTISSERFGLKKIIFLGMAAFYIWLPLFSKVANIGKYVIKTHFLGLKPNAADSIIEGLGNKNNGDKVWLVLDPRQALQIGGRIIFIPDQNSLKIYRSSKPLHISLILPSEIEQNGYGEKIRRAFPQITSWKKCPLEGTTLNEWAAEIKP